MKKNALKVLLYIFLTYSFSTSNAQFSRSISIEEARDQLFKIKLNTLSSMEAYFYYSRGINPSQSAAFLDDKIAQMEHNLLILEAFADKNPAYDSYVENISGYWFSIRNKIIHFFRRGQGIKLYERFSEMNRKIDRFDQKLTSDARLHDSPVEKFLKDALVRTHLLSFLFMAKQMERNNYFDLIFDAQMRNYTAMIDNMEKLETKDKNTQQKLQYLSKLMNDYADYLLTDNPDPEKVYAKVLELHTNMISMLKKIR